MRFTLYMYRSGGSSIRRWVKETLREKLLWLVGFLGKWLNFPLSYALYLVCPSGTYAHLTRRLRLPV